MCEKREQMDVSVKDWLERGEHRLSPEQEAIWPCAPGASERELHCTKWPGTVTNAKQVLNTTIY